MKRFISGTPCVEDRVQTYKQTLIKKYNINEELIRQADLIVLDGFVVKDRNNSDKGFQNVTRVNKVIIGGSSAYGNERLYISFDEYEL